MNAHDIREVRTIDGGQVVICECGKTFDGPRPHTAHERHFWIESARAHLQGEDDE